MSLAARQMALRMACMYLKSHSLFEWPSGMALCANTLKGIRLQFW